MNQCFKYLLGGFCAAQLIGCMELANTYPTYASMNNGCVGNDISIGFSGNVFQTRKVTAVSGEAISLGDGYGPHRRFGASSAFYAGSAETYEVRTPEALTIADHVEACGFITRAPKPKYILDLTSDHFLGDPPDETSWRDAAAVYWPSLTFAYRSDKTYRYAMKIYCADTGKVLMSKEFFYSGYITTLKLVPVLYESVGPDDDYYRQWARQMADEAMTFVLDAEKGKQEK